MPIVRRCGTPRAADADGPSHRAPSDALGDVGESVCSCGCARAYECERNADAGVEGGAASEGGDARDSGVSGCADPFVSFVEEAGVSGGVRGVRAWEGRSGSWAGGF